MLKVVIFDFDGVIQNYPELVWRERKKYLIKNHNVFLDKNDLSNLLGMTLEGQVSYLNNKFKLSLTFDDLNKHRKDILEFIDLELKILDGVKDLIKDLKKNNVKIVIASNKSKEAIELELKKINLESTFDLIFGKNDVIRPKPDPQIFLLILEKLKVKPQECIMIEDAVHGIDGANKVGIRTIGLCSIFHDNFPEADLCINSLKELSYKKLDSLQKKAI